MAPHNGSMSKPSISPVKWGAAQDQWAAAVPNLPLLHILPVPGHGPEDVLFLDGSILTGLDDGRIVKVSQDGWQIEVVGDTQGRPLGLEAHPDGRVVVCDAVKGLLMLDPASGRLDTLVPSGRRTCACATTPQSRRMGRSTSAIQVSASNSNTGPRTCLSTRGQAACCAAPRRARGRHGHRTAVRERCRSGWRPCGGRADRAVQPGPRAH